MFKKCLVILFTLFVSYSVFHRLGVSKPVKVVKNKYKETDKAFCSVLKDLNYQIKEYIISCKKNKKSQDNPISQIVCIDFYRSIVEKDSFDILESIQKQQKENSCK